MNAVGEPVSVPRLVTMIDRAVACLEAESYSISTRGPYRRAWRRLVEFARTDGAGLTFPKLLEGYLVKAGIDPDWPQAGPRPSPEGSRAGSAVRFLEAFGIHPCRWLPSSSCRVRCVPCDLDKLVVGALREVDRLGYRTKAKMSSNWASFRRFAARRAPGEAFSQDLVSRFLAEERGIPEDHRGVPLGPCQRHTLLAMDLLSEYATRGSCRRRSWRRGPITLAPEFDDALDCYLEFCQAELRLRAVTVRLRSKELRRFLEFLGSQGLAALQGLTAEMLSSFVVTLSEFSPATVSRVLSDVRCFLRHLRMRGVLGPGLVEHLPRVRVPRDGRIPSVWKQDDIEALLAAVDRSSPVGKRDYAILLLACRLGLRVSDIKALRLEDIDWEASVLRITQRKTGSPLVLPLGEEVGAAICAYLRHGRPASPHRVVFLKAAPPFDPIPEANKLHHVVTTYRCRAGIRLPVRLRSGLHSLRHTLAIRLLEAGTPFETISEIMGHQTMESTRLYTKVDLKALRSAALDPDRLPGVSDE